MDFDFQWLLLALPITFGLGWLASRFDWRQMRRDEHRSPKAYFKGLTHLLNEQPDQAIDAFIEVVQNDPDTSELHFALGNLFRKRGEFERAVRVHQHLLARSDLKAEDRGRAQYALAQDYMRAGLFDRAETAFTALLQGQHQAEARFSLLQLHERARNWRAAIEVASAINTASNGSWADRIAHHWCELSDDHMISNETDQAVQCARSAIEASPNSLRAQATLAQLLEYTGDAAAGCEQWFFTVGQHPEAIDLLAPHLLLAAQAVARTHEAQAQINAAYTQSYSLDLLDVLTPLEDAGVAHQRYQAHLAAHPSIAAVAAVARTAPPGSHTPAFIQTLEHAASQTKRYRCAACGFESQGRFWQCPGCLSWDSFPIKRYDDA